MSKKVITLVGGRGKMGECFSQWWRNFGYEVRILDRDDWKHASVLLSSSNAVIVAVPIRNTKTVIDELGQFLNQDVVLADITSIQMMPLKAMLSTHKGPVISLHPMFGPTIKDTIGHTIAVTPGREQDKCQWLVNSLEKMGFVCQNIDSQEHDRAMDFIQGLEHFVTISMGIFLHQEKVSLENLKLLSTPIYRVKLNLLGRIFNQDGELYNDIINATGSRLETIDKFLDQSHQLVAEMKEDQNILSEKFNEAATWMGEFTRSSLDESNIILNLKTDGD